MRLAKDTRQTLDLAIEALINLLDAIGPDPDAEPSLGATNTIDQDYGWDLHAGFLVAADVTRIGEGVIDPG